MTTANDDVDTAVDALMTIVHSRPGTPPSGGGGGGGVPLQQQQQLLQLQMQLQLQHQQLYQQLSHAAAAALAPASPVEAYAKLQGEDFVYYVRSLAVSLGRGLGGASGGSNGFPSYGMGPGSTDIDLGLSKTISRQHARIEYNFITRVFEFSVQGKNGAHVDGELVTRESQPVPLETKYALFCLN